MVVSTTIDQLPMAIAPQAKPIFMDRSACVSVSSGAGARPSVQITGGASASREDDNVSNQFTASS